MLPPPITDDAGLLKADLLKYQGWIPLIEDKPLSRPTLLHGYWQPEGTTTEFTLLKDNNLTNIYITPTGKVTVKQVVDTKPGKMYQFSAATYTYITRSGNEGNHNSKYDLSVFPGTIRPKLNSLYYYKVEEDRAFSPNTNIKNYGRQVFIASSDKTTVEYTIYSNNSANWNTGGIINVTFSDLEHAIEESKILIEELFTDSTHTAIKLSTTQLKIDKAKKLISEVLNAKQKEHFLEEVKKAQELLDKVTITLTTEKLTDDRASTNSTTIKGKTYPNAFVFFSGHEDLPKGELNSEVEGDTHNYQTRADKDGMIDYKLPEGSYFRGKQNITIRSVLHGKVVEKNLVVEDVSAPFKPTVLTLKDVSTQIEGYAESEAIIKVFNATTNALMFSGKALQGDRFAINIPETQKPLVPYAEYYVTATDSSGNPSEQSEILSVQDTLAPEADPVRQIVNVGAPLPALESLLTDLSDNAGVDQVKIEMLQEPDLSKAGYTEAILLLSDKANNQLSLTIPFFVKNEDTIDNGTTFLSAQSINALAIDYPKEWEAQKQFILEQSRATAMDMNTFKNRTSELQLTVDSSINEPGTYEVTFSIDSLSRKITLNLLAGGVVFERVPMEISFGVPTLQTNIKYVPIENNMKMIIKNTQYYRTGWALKTKFSKMLQTDTGIKTASDIVFQDKEDLKYMTEEKEIEIYRQKDQSDHRLQEFDFGKESDQQFLLKMMPGSLMKDKIYSAQILWTIETAP
ncbi:hypothetical protein JZO86_02335 [Enterococcus ureasiticus]|uniref:toxin Cry1Ac domain D-VI-related protein n=1 Tax=Enterococcus ureasiticus TaxID=903984 RepID=UPI001A8FFC00|nr:toxin Cry1Ac domain D-VI-related protein [Enterococcus ureasiticus]MBO0472548.1 hypothetical protein [Enterococcus ureasiticus]